MSPLVEKCRPSASENLSLSVRERSRISVDPNVPAARISLRAWISSGFPWRVRKARSVGTVYTTQPPTPLAPLSRSMRITLAPV